MLHNSYLCMKLKTRDMDALSIRDFRNDLAASFDHAPEDLTITPALQKRIDEAEAACREGLCVSCSTTEELDLFFDSL